MTTVNDLARFDAKVRPGPDGCWIWTASVNHQGYGKFWHDGRTVTAHRYAFEQVRGPVPDGQTLDHLCHNAAAGQTCPGGPSCIHRRCVNPDHLKPRTIRDNLLASSAPAAINARKVQCPRGHTYDYVAPSGERQCRTCNRDRRRLERSRA